MPTSIISSIIGSNAAGDAADKQVAASEKASQTQLQMSREANALLEKMFNISREDLASYRTGGNLSLNQQLKLMGLKGLTKQQNALKSFTTSPGYTFRLDEGNKAIQRSAAAKGNLLSPATLKELDSYSQGLASDEYSNYYNRLSGISSLGENAAAQSGNQAISTGQSMSNNLLTTGQSVANNLLYGGNAAAAGDINSANAITGGLNSLANNFLMWKILNK
ncbi:MAG: hypothetical protein ABFD97_18315 [Syntrophobacter sp.]